MLSKVPLRIKFLALLLLGVLAVAIATQLLVRQTVDSQIRAEILGDLRNSVLTFKAFQNEREMTLSRSVELLADLPNVKALMTTQDVATIQDASNDTWQLSGSDLLILAEPTGKVMALHAATSEVRMPAAQQALANSGGMAPGKQWWHLGGHLYEVFIQPIYSGPSINNELLGFVAAGYEINQRVVQDVSHIAVSEVAFLYGDSVVASTLPPEEQPEFARNFSGAGPANWSAQDMRLRGERYLVSTVNLTPETLPDVRLSVLKSHDKAAARFRGLYQRLAGLGVLALLGQTLLAFFIFRRYTRPLDKLVAGVRALGQGDFTYPLDMQGQDELAEVTGSFIRMRDDLQQTQHQLLDSERLATIGRMASSISHDLRHQLTAIVANAEFLCDQNLERQQSEELYQEIRSAVGQMNALIESLLEFSRSRDTFSPSYGRVEETMQRAIRSLQSHPSAQKVGISLVGQGNTEGWFDPKRLERAFYNLLLNACQAVSPETGKVEVKMREIPGGAEISICDNGIGIPERIRDKVFEPFVSYGKENGTGLGLTIVQKILEDHGGTISLENSSVGQTVFKLTVPLGSGEEAERPGLATTVTSDRTTSSK